MFLFVFRAGLHSLQLLSCTDVECSWATKKKDIQRAYAPVPLQAFCHVKRCLPMPEVPAAELREIGRMLCEVAPASAIETQRLVFQFKQRALEFTKGTTQKRKQTERVCGCPP